MSHIGNLPVIDDSNWQSVLSDAISNPHYGRGLIARDYAKQPYGSLEFAEPLPLPLIPESEWDARIKEQEESKSSLVHLCDAAGLKVKNQQKTNYCWINAPAHCIEILRVVQGQKYVELSPASVGAKIKNFRNVGGWGTEGLEYIAEHGLVPSSLWPNNAIDRKYDTPAADAERQKYQADEWWELKPRSLPEMATCLLQNIPVAIGLNWWGHEVTAVRLIRTSNGWGIVIDNSWGTSWGDNGRGVLTGSKMLPDDAVAPRVATAA